MDIEFKTHPECQPGEVFLINCSISEPDEYDDIDYATRRAGNTSYDDRGEKLSGYFPVFVLKAEYKFRYSKNEIT